MDKHNLETKKGESEVKEPFVGDAGIYWQNTAGMLHVLTREKDIVEISMLQQLETINLGETNE